MYTVEHTQEKAMNRPTIRFDDQVAIVTGAGGGMGRCFALALAARGAQVLVNDYGGNIAGQAGTSAAAERVAAEIDALGGRAVANATAVGTPAAARAIVEHAVQAFGRVDLLVNNAGIVVTGLFDAVSDEDVENVLRVNLMGPYALMRAVWPLMRGQGRGRILNVASNAALGIGANGPYASSKAGLLGLTLDAAVEGRPAGIHVNALMPTAFTRMIEQIPAHDFVAWFRQHLPAQAVIDAALYFLSRESAVTGQIYSAGGGRLARVAFAEGRGILDTAITPELVRDRLAEVEAMDAPDVLLSQSDEGALYTRAFPMQNGGSAALSLDAVVGSRGAH
jgi:NAD(P)-dependent dehydrogenase (short-subunit alcohol dehydrogenase family)